MGGTAGRTVETEHFNGTSWTELAAIGAPMEGPFGAGTTTLGLAGGGYPPSTTTYEWALADAIKTFTAS